MKLVPAILLVISLLPLAVAWSGEHETLDELLARIETVPDGDSGLSTEEQAYIAKLLQHQDQAIPRLIELLSHPDRNVAELAAATLRDCTRLDEKYLPQIITGLDRGIGWLAGALGRMESEQAAKEAVKRFLHAPDSPYNQEAYAVILHGTRAIPFLMEALLFMEKESHEADDLPVQVTTSELDLGIFFDGVGENIGGVWARLGYVLGEMDEAARKETAAALRDILKDDRTSETLTGAILVITEYLGKAGLLLEDTLIALRESNPEWRESVDAALISIGSEQSGPIFADQLAQQPDVLVLMSVAETGKAALGAAAEVSKLLEHPDGKIRRAAAMALGFVGYEQAIPRLTHLLNDPSDVIINWIAAQSLGRLHAVTAVDALTLTAEQHWHPSVRAEAKKALSHIRLSTFYEDSNHFPSDFLSYTHFDLDNPPPPPLVASHSPDKRYYKDDPDMLKPLAYNIEIIRYGPVTQAELAEMKERGVISDGMEHRTPVQQIPDVALRVENGWLVGSSRGEWGGELVYIGDDGGGHDTILQENVHDIYSLGKRWIAVTGLSHLTFNAGMIYELTHGENATWQAKPWRALPGAPRLSSKTESGEIFIATYGGGNILLSEDGSMKMAPAE